MPHSSAPCMRKSVALSYVLGTNAVRSPANRASTEAPREKGIRTTGCSASHGSPLTEKGNAQRQTYPSHRGGHIPNLVCQGKRVECGQGVRGAQAQPVREAEAEDIGRVEGRIGVVVVRVAG